MLRIGVIGTRGGWSSETLADTVAELTGERLLIEMDQVRLDLDAGTAWHRGLDLGTLDALIVKKIGARYSPHLWDRLELLRYMSARGLHIFSKPESMMAVLNRLSCTLTLQLGGVPLPPTTITENPDEALDAVRAYGEAVFKPLYTSKARGMIMMADGPGAADRIAEYSRTHPIMYIQKKIDHRGRDLGVAFLGGEYLTTYARRNTDASWNTTTAAGGAYEPYDPPDTLIAAAHKAQALFDLDFTCVDVMESADNEPLVLEVSAFGGFRGIQDARNIDAAKAYAEYVISKF